MIRSITVTNNRGDKLELDLARPELSGFAVISIDGLGPGKANINTTEISTNDGSLFNSARLPSRNIIISIVYMWKDSIEEARLLSYKYFPIRKNIKLLFKTDEREAEIEGYVESNDPKIFSSLENTSISIICPNPFFYSTQKKTTIFSGVESMFEFPFSNEALHEDLLLMGTIQNYREKNIFYDGDADTGVVIKIHALGEIRNITIYNTLTRDVMKIYTDKITQFTGKAFDTGDDIIIDTRSGNKSVTLIRAGLSINIINCIDKNSDWFKLIKGDNIFAYVTEYGITNVQFTIENYIAYEGI